MRGKNLFEKNICSNTQLMNLNGNQFITGALYKYESGSFLSDSNKHIKQALVVFCFGFNGQKILKHIFNSRVGRLGVLGLA